MVDILVNKAVYESLLRGDDAHRIALNWRDELARFERIREQYLIYK
jgi:hypothetical protein